MSLSRAGQYICGIPTEWADDPPAWQGFWRHEVEKNGYQPVGEPVLRKMDDAFGRLSWWVVQGAVERSDTP
ncbi:MAG: hypothetical protein M3P18_00205 [Actinomycetota bacterium]|nr:hypothetical protein [Actinomycetota bacterium]